MTGPLFRSPLTYRPFVASRLADIFVVAKCPTSLCSRCGTAWCVCGWTIKDKSRGEAHPPRLLRRAQFSRTARVRYSGSQYPASACSGVAPSRGDIGASTGSRGRPRLVGAMPAASSARLSLRVSPPVDSRALILEAT